MTSTKQESSIDEPFHQRLLQKCSQNFTIDTLVPVLSHTLFNPGVAWMLVLCLRAQVTPTTDRAWIFTVAYASFLTILFVARVMNQRIAYGVPRTVDASREVVLITGGAGGLGLTIAQMYAMRGVSVAVLDILDCASIDIENLFGGEVLYLQCDVGDRAQVEDAKDRIEKEVRLCLYLFHVLSTGSLEYLVQVLIRDLSFPLILAAARDPDDYHQLRRGWHHRRSTIEIFDRGLREDNPDQSPRCIPPLPGVSAGYRQRRQERRHNCDRQLSPGSIVSI